MQPDALGLGVDRMRSPSPIFDHTPQWHRSPQHSRFQHPKPPNSPFTVITTDPTDSALPRFWSAVPRASTPAGNLRLYHPLGYIAPKDPAAVVVLPDSGHAESASSVHSRFQCPSPPKGSLPKLHGFPPMSPQSSAASSPYRATPKRHSPVKEYAIWDRRVGMRPKNLIWP